MRKCGKTRNISTHTHADIYIYIYIYIFSCSCTRWSIHSEYKSVLQTKHSFLNTSLLSAWKRRNRKEHTSCIFTRKACTMHIHTHIHTRMHINIHTWTYYHINAYKLRRIVVRQEEEHMEKSRACLCGWRDAPACIHGESFVVLHVCVRVFSDNLAWVHLIAYIHWLSVYICIYAYMSKIYVYMYICLNVCMHACIHTGHIFVRMHDLFLPTMHKTAIFWGMYMYICI